MERRITRRRGACNQCKLRKLRCDGSLPRCGTCEKQNTQCVYDKQDGQPKQRPKPKIALSSSGSGSERGINTPVNSSPSPIEDESFMTIYDNLQDSININQTIAIPIPIPQKEKQILSLNMFQDTLLDDNANFNLVNKDESQLMFWPEQDNLVFSPLSDENSSWDILAPLSHTVSSNNTSHNEISKQERCNYLRESATLASLLNSNLKKLESCLQHSLVLGLFENVICKSLITSTHVNIENDEEDLGVMHLHHGRVRRLELQQYISAYFREYQSQYPFICQREFQTEFESFLEKKTLVDPAYAAIINSFLAIGCLAVKSRTDSFDVAYIEAQGYLDMALRSQNRLMGGGATIIKIQALTAMSIASHVLDRLSLALSCISCAVRHALHLRLNSLNKIESLAKTDAERCLLQRIFCVIYSIEKPLAMRLDCCSMINDDFVDYWPRSIQQQEAPLDFSQPQDQFFLMEIYCEYARLCSLVTKNLYGATLAKTPHGNSQEAILFLDNSLEEWRQSSMPFSTKSLQNHNNGWTISIIPELSERQQMDLRLKYHELKFAIHPDTHSSIQAAKEILTDAHHFQLTASDSDWALIRIPIVACCVLLMDIFSQTTSEGRRQNMPFVAMASGWIGRLSIATSKDFGFAELMNLVGLAQQQACIPLMV